MTLSVFLFVIYFPITLQLVPQSQIDALIDIYYSLNAPYWILCKWNITNIVNGDLQHVDSCGYSIKTINISINNTQYEAVKQLQLTDTTNMSGEFPSSMGNLTTLEVFSFNGEFNNIYGTLPKSFWHLTNLQKISLYQTPNLSVTLDASIGNLTNLTYLDLNHVSLSSTIPQIFCSLKSLSHISFKYVNISGTIPDCMFNQLKNLNSFHLFDTNIVEISNSISYASHLQILQLVENQYCTGPIFDYLTNM
eukprot:236513_1